MNKSPAEAFVASYAVTWDPADGRHHPAPLCPVTTRYRLAKVLFDWTFCIAALPVLGLFCLALIFLNPLLNPGPLFFRQQRMGLGCQRFWMWKFRTMRVAAIATRRHDEPLETHRITWLGRFLRRTRIDELPNVLNVMRGEMSVVGPRPDAWEHAVAYFDTVPHYKDRFRVRPGITGLAQVRGGYADTARAVERKARLDHFYVRHARIRLDFRIVLETVRVLLTGFGAK